jgi:hypothetical protein
MKLKREAVAPSKAVSKREERPERPDEADAPITPMLPLSHAHTSSHSLTLSRSPLALSPSKTARHGGGIHLTAPESQERQQERVRRPSPALISGSNASNLRMRAAPSKSLDKEIVWHQHYNLEGDITGTARQESLMEREYQVMSVCFIFLRGRKRNVNMIYAYIYSQEILRSAFCLRFCRRLVSHDRGVTYVSEKTSQSVVE